jgi:hypothetical protein
MPDQDPTSSPTREGVDGRVYVDLMSTVEQCTSLVAHTLPSVDHLSIPPPPVDRAALERLGTRLEHGASGSLLDAFQEWCRRHDEFLGAAASLGEMHGAESRTDYQQQLGERIERVRTSRAELHDATDVLRDRIATEIDDRLG